MSRHVFTINLRDDPAAITTYREHHRRVWPEVVESLRAAGVGLGMKPAPVYLKAGDLVALGIDALGESRQKVVEHA